MVVQYIAVLIVMFCSKFSCCSSCCCIQLLHFQEVYFVVFVLLGAKNRLVRNYIGSLPAPADVQVNVSVIR